MKRRQWAAATLAMTALPGASLVSGGAQAAQSAPASATGFARCVVPAKPGGGFDLTCQLLRQALSADGSTAPWPVVYQPGGIGALVFDEVVRNVRPPGHELIAFSSGSLLNLAQGRFGRHSADQVQWVAGFALDHGVVAVHRESPWTTLPGLLEVLQRQPASVAFAAGGTLGSQDWMKAVLLARAVGVSHRAVRLVAFEGGGDAVQALLGRHVQVLTGDAAELGQQLQQGAALRVLAVLSAHRLSGPLAAVPTAREQGVEVQWPILRGVYTHAQTPPKLVTEWVQRLAVAWQRPALQQAVLRLGMQSVWTTGDELSRRIQDEISRYQQLLASFKAP